jgi:hypothetical protein
MKKWLLSGCMFFLFFAGLTPAFAQTEFEEESQFPEAPRISAHEAYFNSKAGKVILIQAGGEAFSSRHIVGAFEMKGDQEAMRRGEIEFPNYPSTGVEIYTYCY